MQRCNFALTWCCTQGCFQIQGCFQGDDPFYLQVERQLSPKLSLHKQGVIVPACMYSDIVAVFTSLHSELC